MLLQLLCPALLHALCACAFSAEQTTTASTSSDSSASTEHVTVNHAQMSASNQPELTASPVVPASNTEGAAESTVSNPVFSDVQTRCGERSTGENFARHNKALIACLLPFDQSRLFSVQRVRPAIDLALIKVASLELLPSLELEVKC